MRYRRFEPLGRDLSQLVLGTALYEHAPLDTPPDLLDAWVERGGNAIDTGRQYGNAEAIIGRWLAERDLGDSVVVIGKGGHHDEETGRRRLGAGDLAADLELSRRTLGLDTIPLYLLHRDDPRLPAAEILAALQEPLRRGEIGAVGASNWTVERLREAEAAAAELGLEGFCCSSPNLSLADAFEEPWLDCVSVHGDGLAWYEERGFTLLAWSSLAQGFFAGVESEDVARTYASAANLERLRRARALGEKRGFTPSQVALAWVLAQPFPVHAIVGPRSVQELDESLRALDLELTAEERDWLDLRHDEPPDGIRDGRRAARRNGSGPARPLGVAACTWGLEPGYPWVPEYRPADVLEQAAHIGFAGIEPATLSGSGQALRARLDELGLRCPARFVGLSPASDDAVRHAAETVDDLVALGGEVLLIGIEDEGDETALAEVVAAARERGVTPALHPELGSPLATAADIDRRLERVDGLTVCLDSGHLFAAGDHDLAALVGRWGERLSHVHLKDVSGPLAAAVADGRLSVLQAVQRGLWQPLGEGDAPLAELLDALDRSGYAGWLVVEQDFAPDPVASAAGGLAWLAPSRDGAPA